MLPLIQTMIVHIQWQEITNKVTDGPVMLWWGLKCEVSGAERVGVVGLLHARLQGWCPPVCAQGQPPCPASTRGLCCRFKKNLQGWSSFGSPELSASPGCPKPFHKRTCSSLHLPCTFSGKRFKKSGRGTPQGDGPVRPKRALSAQQMGSPSNFPGCSRRLGSYGAELAPWVAQASSSRQDRAQVLGRPHRQAGLAEKGACWLPHRKEVTVCPGPGGRRGCLQWPGWSRAVHSRWRKAGGLRAIDKASWNPAFVGQKDVFTGPGLRWSSHHFPWALPPHPLVGVTDHRGWSSPDIQAAVPH